MRATKREMIASHLLGFAATARIPSNVIICIEVPMKSASHRLLVGGAAIALLTIMTASSARAQSQCDAVAGNLVTNCGFETGSFSGWTPPAGANQITGSFAHSGNEGWGGGTVGSVGHITQSISTIAGNTYDVSFWYFSNGQPTSELYASFAGVQLVDQVNPPASSFNQYTYQVTASSSSSVLDLGIRQDPGYSGLDDVVITEAVVATPEPASMGLLATGLIAIGAGLRRRKRLT